MQSLAEKRGEKNIISLSVTGKGCGQNERLDVVHVEIKENRIDLSSHSFLGHCICLQPSWQNNIILTPQKTCKGKRIDKHLPNARWRRASQPPMLGFIFSVWISLTLIQSNATKRWGLILADKLMSFVRLALPSQNEERTSRGRMKP